jgi:hypothetical protein
MRLGILAILMLVSAVLGLAELGVATIFDMKFEGLSYLTYTRAFFSVPEHAVLGGIVILVIFTITTEITYRLITKSEG